MWGEVVGCGVFFWWVVCLGRGGGLCVLVCALLVGWAVDVVLFFGGFGWLRGSGLGRLVCLYVHGGLVCCDVGWVVGLDVYLVCFDSLVEGLLLVESVVVALVCGLVLFLVCVGI